MKVTNIEWERLELELTEPYTIAYEQIGSATNFILKLHTDTGLIGYGCAAPDAVVTGESPAEVELALTEHIAPFLAGKQVFTYAYLLTELAEVIGNSALCMVDTALHDLMAKKAGVPLYQLLGGYRSSIHTSITIGIMSEKETYAKAKEFIAQGFNIIKIKGGLDVDEDIRKIEYINNKHPELVLRFDGNQGYSKEAAIYFIDQTEKYGLEFLEQPTPVKQEKLMAELTAYGNLPIMADESLKTIGDAFSLTSNNQTSLINIKLMKVGGLLQGQHINSIAKSANNEVMIGCLDECGLGIAAGLHFALSRPNITYADLDGHLDFVHDPYKQLFKLQKGCLYPSDKPGIGC